MSASPGPVGPTSTVYLEAGPAHRILGGAARVLPTRRARGVQPEVGEIVRDQAIDPGEQRLEPGASRQLGGLGGAAGRAAGPGWRQPE